MAENIQKNYEELKRKSELTEKFIKLANKLKIDDKDIRYVSLFKAPTDEYFDIYVLESLDGKHTYEYSVKVGVLIEVDPY